MWYLILALLFGNGGNCDTPKDNGQTTVTPYGDRGGETETPRPPKG
ncbi:MAG: hypothetical protein ACN6PN_02975 [Sphingobacterium sp.]